MTGKTIGSEIEREEVVLPVVESSDSPTSDKEPMKLRFWPKPGKRINPAVRLILCTFALTFVLLLVYGVARHSAKRQAQQEGGGSDDKRAFTDAGQAGEQVWGDLENQRKLDALKAKQELGNEQGGDNRQGLPRSVDLKTGLQVPGLTSAAGIPNDVVGRDSRDVVPPLVARGVGVGSNGHPSVDLAASSRATGSAQPSQSARVNGVKNPEQEWRDEAYKEELAARNAGTSISGRDSNGGGSPFGALTTAAAQGPAGALQQLVSQFAARGGGAAAPSASMQAPGEQQDDNLQAHKESFIEKARESRVENDYSTAQRMAPLTKYEIKAGWDIPATLESAVNTDLPGEAKAIVRQNVYDTATGRYLLIPQGARLVGRYDNRISYGQSRCTVIWTRLIFPDGSSVDLDGMIGHDAEGAAGFHDQVDNHYVRLVSTALMLSAFTAGIQLSQPQTNSVSGYLTPSQQATQALGQQFGQLGIEVSRKNLNIQPTVKIRKGYRFNVRVNRDIAFTEPYTDGLAVH